MSKQVYVVSRFGNKLLVHIKTSSTFSDFTRKLKAFDLANKGLAVIVILVYSLISISFLTVYVILTLSKYLTVVVFTI